MISGWESNEPGSRTKLCFSFEHIYTAVEPINKFMLVASWLDIFGFRTAEAVKLLSCQQDGQVDGVQALSFSAQGYLLICFGFAINRDVSYP